MQELGRRVISALQMELAPIPTRPWVQGETRPAAVLILFGSEDGTAHDPSILLTRRSEKLDNHRGQMAFPGGVCDPEDGTPLITALRETEEEVGIARQHIEVLGKLPQMATLTGFTIEPVVGMLKTPISHTALRVNEDEIAETMWIRMSQLLDPATYREEPPLMHVYYVAGHRVWGATAFILKNLLDRLNRVELR